MQGKRMRGPVTRRYRVEYDIAGLELTPPPPEAPLRVHRAWADALALLYPEAKESDRIKLLSLPGLTADTIRSLKPVVRRS